MLRKSVNGASLLDLEASILPFLAPRIFYPHILTSTEGPACPGQLRDPVSSSPSSSRRHRVGNEPDPLKTSCSEVENGDGAQKTAAPKLKRAVSLLGPCLSVTAVNKSSRSRSWLSPRRHSIAWLHTQGGVRKSSIAASPVPADNLDDGGDHATRQESTRDPPEREQDTPVISVHHQGVETFFDKNSGPPRPPNPEDNRTLYDQFTHFPNAVPYSRNAHISVRSKNRSVYIDGHVIPPARWWHVPPSVDPNDLNLNTSITWKSAKVLAESKEQEKAVTDSLPPAIPRMLWRSTIQKMKHTAGTGDNMAFASFFQDTERWLGELHRYGTVVKSISSSYSEWSESERRNRWPKIMLKLMKDDPAKILPMLLATNCSPWPEPEFVSDCLLDSAEFYLSKIQKFNRTSGITYVGAFMEAAAVLSQRKVPIPQKALNLVAYRCSGAQFLRICHFLSTSQVVLRSNTLLHFSYVASNFGMSGLAFNCLSAAIDRGAAKGADSTHSVCTMLIRDRVLKYDDYAGGMQMINRILGLGISLGSHLILAIVQSVLRAGNVAHALRLFDDLTTSAEGQAPFPFHEIHSDFLAACVHSDDERSTAKVLRRILENRLCYDHPGIGVKVLRFLYDHHLKKGTEDIYNAVLSTYREIFVLEPLKTLGIVPLDLLQDQPGIEPWSMVPSPEAVGFMTKIWLKVHGSRDPVLAKQLYENFRTQVKLGHKVIGPVTEDDTVYRVFIEVLGQSTETIHMVSKIPRDMLSPLPSTAVYPARNRRLIQVKPTIDTWIALAGILVKHRHFDLGNKVIDRINLDDGPIPRWAFNRLLHLQLYLRNPVKAAEVLQRMVASGARIMDSNIAHLRSLPHMELLIQALSKCPSSPAGITALDMGLNEDELTFGPDYGSALSQNDPSERPDPTKTPARAAGDSLFRDPPFAPLIYGKLTKGLRRKTKPAPSPLTAKAPPTKSVSRRGLGMPLVPKTFIAGDELPNSSAASTIPRKDTHSSIKMPENRPSPSSSWPSSKPSIRASNAVSFSTSTTTAAADVAMGGGLGAPIMLGSWFKRKSEDLSSPVLPTFRSASGWIDPGKICAPRPNIQIESGVTHTFSSPISYSPFHPPPPPSPAKIVGVSPGPKKFQSLKPIDRGEPDQTRLASSMDEPDDNAVIRDAPNFSHSSGGAESRRKVANVKQEYDETLINFLEASLKDVCESTGDSTEETDMLAEAAASLRKKSSPLPAQEHGLRRDALPSKADEPPELKIRRVIHRRAPVPRVSDYEDPGWTVSHSLVQNGIIFEFWEYYGSEQEIEIGVSIDDRLRAKPRSQPPLSSASTLPSQLQPAALVRSSHLSALSLPAPTMLRRRDEEATCHLPTLSSPISRLLPTTLSRQNEESACHLPTLSYPISRLLLPSAKTTFFSPFYMTPFTATTTPPPPSQMEPNSHAEFYPVLLTSYYSSPPPPPQSDQYSQDQQQEHELEPLLRLDEVQYPPTSVIYSSSPPPPPPPPSPPLQTAHPPVMDLLLSADPDPYLPTAPLVPTPVPLLPETLPNVDCRLIESLAPSEPLLEELRDELNHQPSACFSSSLPPLSLHPAEPELNAEDFNDCFVGGEVASLSLDTELNPLQIADLSLSQELDPPPLIRTYLDSDSYEDAKQSFQTINDCNSELPPVPGIYTSTLVLKPSRTTRSLSHI